MTAIIPPAHGQQPPRDQDDLALTGPLTKLWQAGVHAGTDPEFRTGGDPANSFDDEAYTQYRTQAISVARQSVEVEAGVWRERHRASEMACRAATLACQQRKMPRAASWAATTGGIVMMFFAGAFAALDISSLWWGIALVGGVMTWLGVGAAGRDVGQLQALGWWKDSLGRETARKVVS